MIESEINRSSNDGEAFGRERKRSKRRTVADERVERLCQILQRTKGGEWLSSDEIIKEMFPGVHIDIARERFYEAKRGLSARADLLAGWEILRGGVEGNVRSYRLVTSIGVSSEVPKTEVEHTRKVEKKAPSDSTSFREELRRRKNAKNAELPSVDIDWAVKRLRDDITYNLLSRLQSFKGMFSDERGKYFDRDPLVLMGVSSLTSDEVAAVSKKHPDDLGEFVCGLFSARLRLYWDGKETTEDLQHIRSRKIRESVQYFKDEKVDPDALIARVREHYLARSTN